MSSVSTNSAKPPVLLATAATRLTKGVPVAENAVSPCQSRGPWRTATCTSESVRVTSTGRPEASRARKKPVDVAPTSGRTTSSAKLEPASVS